MHLAKNTSAVDNTVESTNRVLAARLIGVRGDAEGVSLNGMLKFLRDCRPAWAPESSVCGSHPGWNK